MPQCPDLPLFDATLQYQTVTFDFGPLVQLNYPPGTVLTGSPTITCTLFAGTDSSPSSRIVGSAQIGTAQKPRGSGLPNCAVFQQFGNLISGATYIFRCTCALSSGDTDTLWVYATCQ